MERRKTYTIMQVVLLLFSVMLSCVMPKQVFAETEKGSITITLKDIGTSKNNVAFKVYQVGTWEQNSAGWNIITELADTNVSFTDLNVAADWETAANTLATCTQLTTLTSKSGSTDENGSLVFSDLELGMYLIIQEGESAYGTIAPFLSALPYVKDGRWNYDLTVKPKAEPPAGGNGTETPPAGGNGTETPPAGGSGTETPPVGGNGTEIPPAEESGTETSPAEGSGAGSSQTTSTGNSKKDTNTSEKETTDSSERSETEDSQTLENESSQMAESSESQTTGEETTTDGSADSTNTDSATTGDNVSEKTADNNTIAVVVTAATVTIAAVVAGIAYKKGIFELLKKVAGKLFKGKRG